MSKLHKQNEKVNLVSVKTIGLKKKQILSICKLKNLVWPWTIKKQLEYFKKTVKKNDINNLLIFKNKLIGYSLLRKRKAYINNKSVIYYYLDSFSINKNIRNKGYGKALLLHNNKIVKKNKKHCFLICPQKSVSFYSKFDWKTLKT